MSDSKNNMEYIKKLESRVTELEERLERVTNILEHIEGDIYEDEDFDFEIVCPYCNNEFAIDLNENMSEVNCPECDNKIELEWSSELDEDEYGCSGSCSRCNGCDIEDEDM